MAGSSPAMTVEGAVAAPELVPWRLDAFGLGAGRMAEKSYPRPFPPPLSFPHRRLEARS